MPMAGIFCRNYCESQGEWPPCQQVWHEACYECLGQGLFPLKKLEDELGNPWHKQEDHAYRVNHDIKGVHAVIPFQCEVCWMRNLEGRSPLPEGLDSAYVMTTRRANIDAMAGKARGTIAKHVAEVKLMVINSELIGKTPNLHVRGPYPLADVMGMGVAVNMLQRSITSKGRIKDHIQFRTM